MSFIVVSCSDDLNLGKPLSELDIDTALNKALDFRLQETLEYSTGMDNEI